MHLLSHMTPSLQISVSVSECIWQEGIYLLEMNPRPSVIGGVEDEFNTIDVDLDGAISKEEMAKYVVENHCYPEMTDVSAVTLSVL